MGREILLAIRSEIALFSSWLLMTAAAHGTGASLGSFTVPAIAPAETSGATAPVYSKPSDPSQLETWRHSGTGPLAANPYKSIAFVRSNDEMDLPAIELLFGVNPPESLAADTTVSGFTTDVATLHGVDSCGFAGQHAAGILNELRAAFDRGELKSLPTDEVLLEPYGRSL